ncbi:thioesterase II family protein (plasmid) [Streptomyces galilaeus]
MSIPDAHSQAWVRRFHPEAGGPCRLVCLPHAGGTASFFFPFSQRLAGRADVLAIQYPGRQDRRREAPLETVEELVGAVQRALRPYDGLPLVLLGHSMGAVLAFELARRLEREGRGPLGLIVSGRRAVDVLREDRVHTLGDDALIEEVRVLAGTDPGLLQDEEIRSMVLPALRADFRAVETYRYRPDGSMPPLRCPLSVLTGTADPRVSLQEAMGWRELTGGPFGFRTFPGGHFYLADQPDAVCEAVAEDLCSFAQGRVHASVR